ncbi:MAG: trypsin-like peptidase domain-containing protein [Myxococcales bacterium]|nr:trypsin-like peptidase domain-containing protein [Myxococcales bacterium]
MCRVVVTALAALSCATPAPTPPSPPPAPAKALPAESLGPKRRAAGAPVAQSGLEDLKLLLSIAREPPLFAGESLAPRIARVPLAKGDVQDIYRKVAPATVLVRSGRGFGTGVVVDEAGFVLTNEHVVANGLEEDFRTKVWIELGTLTEQGVMEKTGKVYEGYVHKSDPLLDLAVVKLAAPPPGLTAVKVSKKDPMPGEAVSAIGNGGIGLLWAIKDGEISAIGKLATHLAQLAAAECEVTSDPVAAAACGRDRQNVDSMRKSYEERIPGLVVQSSCPLSPGDSGGPLVNRAGELVGVNAFVRSHLSAPVAASFHVHVAEVRSFLAEVPAEPVHELPQPWRDAGSTGTMADVDLDGWVDLLSLGSLSRSAFFFDLDQDSFAGSGAVPAVAEVVKARSFDAEVVVLRTPERVVAWYDLDNDSELDRMVVGDERRPGRAQAAYSLRGEALEKLALPKEARLIDPQAFSQPAQAELAARLTRVAALSLPRSVAPSGLEAPATAIMVPDPLWGGGRSGVGVDADRNGKLDSIWAISPFSSALIVDADESVLGGLAQTEVKRALEERGVGANFSIVLQGAQMWSFVDTGGDEKFDLLLYSRSWASGVAGEAYRLENGKPAAPAVEHVGLKLVRPGLIGTGRPAARTRSAVLRLYPRHLVAADDSPASALPSPWADVGTDVDFEDPGLPGFERAVVSVLGRGASSVLFDLDRDTFRKKVSRAEVARVVSSGGLKAEFAWMGRGGSEWTFYDTDRDGRFDLVLFTSKPSTGESEQAFRIDRNGQLTADSEAAKGKMLRASLFKKELARSFRALAPVFFRRTQIDEG